MKSAVAVFLGLLIGFAVIPIAGTGAAISLQEKPTKKNSDEYPGPIVDYDLDFQVSARANPKERELRAARGRRYNKRAPEPLAELPYNWGGYATGTDGYLNLPALPVQQSDAVIVGEVTASEAHISNDQTGVYSEFSIRVDEILKNLLDSSLNVGDVSIGEREGGVVRFQDGRLFKYEIYHQGMPRIGRKYLFFLSRNKDGEDYSIVTAYELREGRVVPLDHSNTFDSFEGVAEQVFLERLRREILNTLQRPKG